MYDSRSSDNGHVKRNREHGWGDYCEWNTPRSRRLATRENRILAIAEGLDERVEEAYTFGLFAEIEAEVLERDEIVLIAAYVERTAPATMDPTEREALNALRRLARLDPESAAHYAHQFDAAFGYYPL